VVVAGRESVKEMVVEVGSFLAFGRAALLVIVASRPPRRKRLGERDRPVTVSGAELKPGVPEPGVPNAGVLKVTRAPLLAPCALAATSATV
jgi:hypothetical protein